MNGIALVKRVVLIVVLLVSATKVTQAQDFRLQVGPPAAVMPQQGAVAEKKVSKDVLFVIRPLGCGDPASARITVTAEGVVDGSRRRQMPMLASLPAPGVHAVSWTSPDSGVWVLSVAGTCDGRTAGAIVRLGPRNLYRREGVEMVAHHPSAAQIDRALRASTADAAPVALGR